MHIVLHDDDVGTSHQTISDGAFWLDLDAPLLP